MHLHFQGPALEGDRPCFGQIILCSRLLAVWEVRSDRPDTKTELTTWSALITYDRSSESPNLVLALPGLVSESFIRDTGETGIA